MAASKKRQIAQIQTEDDLALTEPFRWKVYILRCRDGTLYTGITTDLERRLKEHNQSARGASYTRARRPVQLVYSAPFANRSTASRRESEVKRMTKEKKESLINDPS